jgi:hypothetical protein
MINEPRLIKVQIKVQFTKSQHIFKDKTHLKGTLMKALADFILKQNGLLGSVRNVANRLKPGYNA